MYFLHKMDLNTLINDKTKTISRSTVDFNDQFMKARVVLGY